MISNYILRKLEKTKMSPAFTLPIKMYIKNLSQKYPKKCDQKIFTLKRVSQHVLKICRKMIDAKNLDQCLMVFEFVKSLMNQIYEGISYQIYLIKTQLNILIMRWFQISVKNKKHKRQMIKVKQQIFILRNKLFINQIQNSPLCQLFFKDFYSNIELIFFQIIKLEIKNRQYQNAALTIRKTFQALKMQVLDLNELLFYLQKKVYNVLANKTNLMMDLFVLDAITNFLNLFVEDRVEFQSTMENQKWKQLKMNNIWAKYGRIFQKLPNNIEKQQCFQKVQAIISNNMATLTSTQQQMQKIQQENDQSESYNSDSKSQQSSSSKQNESNIQNQSQFLKTKNRQKRRSSFKNMKQDHYEDFINFLIEQDHIKKLQNITEDINSKDKQTQLKLFKQVFAKSYLKKQQKQISKQIQIQQDQQIKKTLSNQKKCGRILANQKEFNVKRLNRLKSNSLTLLQRKKSQQTQKLRHNNPFLVSDDKDKKRCYSVDVKGSNCVGKIQVLSELHANNNFLMITGHQKKNNRNSIKKSIPSIQSSKFKLPILIIK